jgi:hypothetical protein
MATPRKKTAARKRTLAKHPRPAARAPRNAKPARKERWSQRVGETSDALDLRRGVFTLDDPQAIARSLRRSAEKSRRRKSDPFRSAMSMLTFYINRAGTQLPKRRRAILERAKVALREMRVKRRNPTTPSR